MTPDLILERVQAAVPVRQLRPSGDQRGVSALQLSRGATHAGASRAGADPGPLPERPRHHDRAACARPARGRLPSSLLGPGTELAMIRPDVPGDDVRMIDWAVTARTGEPHVRVQLAERVLVTWLALHTSPSMNFGTADRTKAGFRPRESRSRRQPPDETREQVLSVMFGAAAQALAAWSARCPWACSACWRRSARSRPALSMAAASARPLSALPPTVRPRSHVSAGSSWSSPTFAARGAGTRRCSSSPRGTRRSRAEIRYLREQELANAGDLGLIDAETGRHVRVDMRSARLRACFAEAAEAERRNLASALLSIGVRHTVLTTSGDWLRSLAAFLRRGGEPLRRRGRLCCWRCLGWYLLLTSCVSANATARGALDDACAASSHRRPRPWTAAAPTGRV